jgi:hypothetical protein
MCVFPFQFPDFPQPCLFVVLIYLPDARFQIPHYPLPTQYSSTLTALAKSRWLGVV